MGLPGLRHAKEALKPHHMSEMYNAWFPEDREVLLDMGLIGGQMEERLENEHKAEESGKTGAAAETIEIDPLRTSHDTE